MKQSNHAVTTAYAKYINPSFIKLLGTLGYGRVYARAEGVYLWDVDGKRYLDCLAGFGSINIGHNHPALLAHLHQILDSQAMHFCHVGPAAGAAQLAEKFAALLSAPLEISLFASGGAEAVEAHFLPFSLLCWRQQRWGRGRKGRRAALHRQPGPA